MIRILIACACMVAATTVGARNLAISPANPTAMEFVHLRTSINGECETVQGIDTVEGGFRVVFKLTELGIRCDTIEELDITLGAFPPGTYRISTRVNCISCSPPFFDEPQTLTFTVAPGVASAIPGDDRPQSDLSGLWTTPNDAFTGFAFVHSGGIGAQGRRNSRVTGLWYDYSGTQPTWSLLLLDDGAGQVVRAAPTGSGASRTIALVPIGTATLTRGPASNPNHPLRLVGTIDGRSFDLPLERFRWTRAAWPARAPDPR